MVAAFSLIYAIGAPQLGVWSDRLGKRRIIVYGLLGFAASNALTSVAPSFAILTVSRLLAGYAFFPAFQLRLARRFPDKRAFAMAWNNTALNTGITLGSLLGGRVMTTVFRI